MHTLVGLGNPGQRYSNTRHNIGYIIVDFFSGIDKIPFKTGKGDYYYKKVVIENNQILICKPTTYMNNSGLAVRQITDYFSIPAEDLLIVCDDYNLPFGTLRFRKRGSDGGHNGLKSVIYHMHTEDFARFRIGIGTEFADPVKFVLNKFNKRESEILNDLLPISVRAIKHWITEGTERTMNIYNGLYTNENG